MDSIRLPITDRLNAILGLRVDRATPHKPPTYGDLTRVLQKQGDNPEFWAPLTELLRELIDAAINGKAAAWQHLPQLKMLAAWDADDLAKRLREALPQWPDVDCDSHVALRERSASGHDSKVAVLGALLLLGLAAGCSNSASPTGTANDAGIGSTGGASSVQDGGTGGTFTCPYPVSDAGAFDVNASDAGTPPACSTESVNALWNAIEGACLTSEDRQAIFAEFADLKASWCEGLVELFKNESADVIAAQLETILMCGTTVASSEFTTAIQQRIVQGMCNTVTLYKGVSFPDSEPSHSQPPVAEPALTDPHRFESS